MINSLKADTTIAHVVGYTPALKILIYKNMSKYIHPFIYKINIDLQVPDDPQQSCKLF